MRVICIVITSFLMTLCSFNASPTDQDQQRQNVDLIGSDLTAMELSDKLALQGTRLTERIAEFEKNYIQRISALETKLEIYTNALENNNALEVTAEMMKIVMTLQEKIQYMETENTEKRQNVRGIQGELTELNQMVRKHDEKIQNVSDDMRELGHEVEMRIQQKEHDVEAKMQQLGQNVSDDMRELGHEVEMRIQQNEHDVEAKIQQLGHNLTSADNVLMSELHHRINALEKITDLIKGRQNALKPRDCEDVFRLGNTIDGVYTIYRDNSQYEVYCDMNRHGWTVFQRRFDGSTDFYRNWTSYVTGFGDTAGEFWLGLDKLYELTSSATYSLRFDMEDHSGVWKFAVYSNFRLGDASANYTLNYNTYTGTAGDALNHGKGYRFSTYDHDFNTCSVRYSGAWWYKNCHNSNLNGLYGNTEYAKGMIWFQWHGDYYSLKTTEMKIRRM